MLTRRTCEYVDVVFLDQEPEESPSSSQPCGRGDIRSRSPLLRVSSGSGWKKRRSAHPGRAESYGAIHRRVSEGLFVKLKTGPVLSINVIDRSRMFMFIHVND